MDLKNVSDESDSKAENKESELARIKRASGGERNNNV